MIVEALNPGAITIKGTEYAPKNSGGWGYCKLHVNFFVWRLGTVINTVNFDTRYLALRQTGDHGLSEFPIHQYYLESLVTSKRINLFYGEQAEQAYIKLSFWERVKYIHNLHWSMLKDKLQNPDNDPDQEQTDIIQL